MRIFNREEFEKLKNEVNSEYKKVGSIYNPALKTEIVFNSNGLYHLYFNYQRIKRSELSQYNKIRFFKSSLNILKLSRTIQEYRSIINYIDMGNNLEKYSTTEWFAFWSIISFKKKIRIKVIVRRVGGNDGQYHFWSIMPYWSLSRKNRIIGNIDLEDE